jgi:hypothetical protein
VKDTTGDWATQDTWTCGEGCGCKAQDAITNQLTDPEDME